LKDATSEAQLQQLGWGLPKVAPAEPVPVAKLTDDVESALIKMGWVKPKETEPPKAPETVSWF